MAEKVERLIEHVTRRAVNNHALYRDMLDKTNHLIGVTEDELRELRALRDLLQRELGI